MTYPAASDLRRLATRMVAALAAVSLTGCTLIGYGIGLNEDRKASFPSAPPTALTRIRPRDQVRVFLRDGGLREGPYGGLAPASADHEARFAAARGHQGPRALPALGQRVEVERTGGGREQGTFGGFELGSLLVNRDGEAGPRSIPFEEVGRLSWGEDHNRGSVLEARLVAGQLPCRSRLLVGGAAIAVEDVARLEAPAVRGSAAAKGALIGAVLDITALVVTGLAISNADFALH